MSTTECMTDGEFEELKNYIGDRMSQNVNFLGYTRQCLPHAVYN